MQAQAQTQQQESRISNLHAQVLSQPRGEYEAPNPFIYSDFRGMLTPDADPAIKNSNLENSKIVKLARRTFSH